jgi:putative hydrolase
MDAAAALNEIAYWLERDLASPFKTKAFRKAATVVGEWSPEELSARRADGRLKSTKGIGDTTYAVIADALDGDVPEYLADLRARLDHPLTTGGEVMRTRLRGDLHSHTDWSDGTTSIELMADTARWLGHEYLAITDHSPNLRVANGLDSSRLRKQVAEVAAINTKADEGFTLLTGIEVDILESGELDQMPVMLEKVDVVVASVHSKLRADSPTMTRRMLAGVSDPQTNILGHVTGRLVTGSRGTRPESAFDACAVFTACAENDVAVEINSRPERRDPPGNLIRLALELGCLFSIDSDAHAPGQLGFLDYGAARAAEYDIPSERIVTTWPLERLRAWLGNA